MGPIAPIGYSMLPRSGRSGTRKGKLPAACSFALPSTHPLINQSTAMNPFDTASPFDARYYLADEDFFQRLHPFVSESAQVKYLARVEAALAETLAEFGVCTPAQAKEIAEACQKITPEEVYDEERRIQHNIRALVNCIRAK